MKTFLTIIIILATQFYSFSQDITIDWGMQNGTVNSFYIKNDLSVTKVSPSGEVLEFLIFDSNTKLNIFQESPKEIHKPKQSINIDGVDVYFESFSTMGYYSPNTYNAGKIKQIGNIVIDYYTKNQYNSGKIKKIGNVPFNYFNPNQYNPGKVKEIGTKSIKYNSPNQFNSEKVNQISDIMIDYYTKNQFNSGKLKKIGNILIEYYTPNEYNAGKFKRITGDEPRIRLLNNF